MYLTATIKPHNKNFKCEKFHLENYHEARNFMTFNLPIDFTASDRIEC